MASGLRVTVLRASAPMGKTARKATVPRANVLRASVPKASGPRAIGPKGEIGPRVAIGPKAAVGPRGGGRAGAKAATAAVAGAGGPKR